jgi:hypothetical protein
MLGTLPCQRVVLGQCKQPAYACIRVYATWLLGRGQDMCSAHTAPKAAAHRLSLLPDRLCGLVRLIVQRPLQLRVQLQLKDEVHRLLIHQCAALAFAGCGVARQQQRLPVRALGAAAAAVGGGATAGG